MRVSPFFALCISVIFVLSASLPSAAAGLSEEKAIVIGLDADFSGNAPQSGEAIKRGILLAIEEINAAGGVLGRKFELVHRDNRGIPARGVDNLDDLLKLDDLVAVVGGLHSPVMLAQLETIHKTKLVFFSAWAAATTVIDNDYDPNFVFRVSIRDEYASGFLIRAAMDRGFHRPGLLLWKSGWGSSNEKAMRHDMARAGIKAAKVEWFNSTERDLSRQIDRLKQAGADVIMLVANPDEGLAAVQAVAALPEGERLPIISHWGITGDDFFNRSAYTVSSVDLEFIQTFSFYKPPFPARAAKVLAAYCIAFGGCLEKGGPFSPVGTAHAYDIVKLLARAIEQAGTTERGKVRDALENLGRYDGLVRVYDPPFTPERHDALDASDFQMARFGQRGEIRPISIPTVR
jgi:branched-chain amino acid transport system substrate-binding protein